MWAGDLYKVNRLVFMWEGTWTQGFMIDNPDVAAITKTAFINSLAPDGKQAVKFDSHIMSIPTGVDAEGHRHGQEIDGLAGQERRRLVEIWPGTCQCSRFRQILRCRRTHRSRWPPSSSRKLAAPIPSSKYFIEIQTAWETAVGNALANAKADVAAELKKGNEQIQAILDRP